MFNCKADVDILISPPQKDFVETPFIQRLTQQALDYIKAGFPVHFKGPTGIGKTTLALHTAEKLGRPAVFISGNEELNTSNLVGGLYGYNRKYLRDNYIGRVLKIEENTIPRWVDDRLTIACENGFTLIYDEFSRSRPETNNILLSILQEKILPLPRIRKKVGYLQVHPDFTAIFTSNPEEYAGVYETQDALRDRMVTIELEAFDEETEVAITQAKSGLGLEECKKLVNLVRIIRKAKINKTIPTVRSCIVTAKVLKLRSDFGQVTPGFIKQTCLEVIMPEVPKEERKKVQLAVEHAQFNSG